MTSENATQFQLMSLAMLPGIGSVVFEREMESTNSTMLKMGKVESDALPLLLIAETQTAGRGRENNQWFADLGGLTFSIGLNKKELKVPPTLLALVAGLSVQRGLSEFCPKIDFQLKWPNDVLVKGNGNDLISPKKICGVLVESNSRLTVIGVGVNINNKSFPAKTATSLKMELDAEANLELQPVLESILLQFFWALELAEKSPYELTTYCRDLMYHMNKTIRVEVPDGVVTGKNSGLGKLGELLVETGSEILSIVSGKNIRLVQ